MEREHSEPPSVENRFDTSGDRTETFHCGKKEFDLILNDNRLEWREHNSKKKENDVSVPLDEIIAVNFVKSLKSEDTADLTINYVGHRKSSFVLKCSSVIFSALTSICEEWMQAIKWKQKSGFAQPRKLLVFVNPVSGNSKAEKIYRTEAAPLFALAGVETVVIITEKAHHCTEVLLTYNLSNIDGVVVCGGDGIYSECVNGLVDRVQKEAGIEVDNPDARLKSITVPIGIIPAGTGNGIAIRCCGCLSVKTSVLSIIMGRNRPSNILSVFSDGNFLTHSALLVGYGFFSDVIYFTETHRQYGKMRYMWMFTKCLEAFRTIELDVSYHVEDETKSPADGIQSSIPISNESQKDKSNWVTVKGAYINVVNPIQSISQMQKITETSTSDENHLQGTNTMVLILQSMCSKWQMVKFLLRLMKQAPNSIDFDFIKAIDTKAYKLKIIPQARRSVEEGKQKCLNVDGDIFMFNGLDFEVRFHADLVSLFCPLVLPPK